MGELRWEVVGEGSVDGCWLDAVVIVGAGAGYVEYGLRPVVGDEG
ncbi:hypothetical protein [Plantactinospora sp. B5E13]